MTPTETVWESQSEIGVAGARRLEERRPTGQGSWEGIQPQPDLCPRLGQMPGNGAGFLGRVTEGQGPQLEGGNPKRGELGGQSGPGHPPAAPSRSSLLWAPPWGWQSFAESGFLRFFQSLLPCGSGRSKSLSSPKNRRVSAPKSPSLGIDFRGGGRHPKQGRGQINEPVSVRPRRGDSSRPH